MADIDGCSCTIDDATYITADGLGSPVGVKDRDKCGVLPEYLNGAVCYRVCGEIPRGRTPKKVEFFSRASYQMVDTPWQSCEMDGCQGSDFEFDQENSKICGMFKLWRGDGSHRDLMMKVMLK
jgi:hypothetical protein